MLRELFVSVASGLIVALVLGLFKRGASSTPRRGPTIGYDPPPRPGSLFGGLTRLILAAGGGIALAYGLAPIIFGRRFGHFGGYGRFDRFDGYGSLTGHVPMIMPTVLGTLVVWALLSVLTRR